MLGLPPYLPISNVHDALLFSSERAISAQLQRPGSMWPRKRHALIGKPVFTARPGSTDPWSVSGCLRKQKVKHVKLVAVVVTGCSPNRKFLR